MPDCKPHTSLTRCMGSTGQPQPPILKAGKKTKKMKLITNTHLTAKDKAAIKAIHEAGMTKGRVGRKDYFLCPDGANLAVTIKVKDRGLGFIGDGLRLSTYTHIVQL